MFTDAIEAAGLEGLSAELVDGFATDMTERCRRVESLAYVMLRNSSGNRSITVGKSKFCCLVISLSSPV
jgi:hypothetical protein